LVRAALNFYGYFGFSVTGIWNKLIAAHIQKLWMCVYCKKN